MINGWLWLIQKYVNFSITSKITDDIDKATDDFNKRKIL